MSAASRPSLHPDEKIKLGSLGSKVVAGGLGVGILCLLLTVILGAAKGDEFRRFFFSYLVGFSYALSIALGALFFVVLQHLVRARWSVVVRRLAEIIAMGALPVLLLLSLVILIPTALGYDELYYWSSELAHSVLPDGTAFDHLVHHKGAWLTAPFWALRVILYFAIWIAIARYFYKKSVAQDDGTHSENTDRLRRAAGPAIIAFALTLTFASFDLLMSLDPHWFSTIYSVWYFAGCALTIMCVLALVSMGLQRSGRLQHSVTTEHYHDLGKLTFAFVFFWGYISFSQFMLIWYANIPEETIWYQHRMFTSWKWVSLALLFLHFIVPFVLLLSRETKRRLPVFAGFAGYLMIMHWVDIYWNVVPEYPRYDPDWMAGRIAAGLEPVFPLEAQGINFHAMDVLATVGILGIVVAAVAMVGRKVKLIPTGDPRLPDSLRFENF
jgi:hypothetical protein